MWTWISIGVLLAAILLLLYNRRTPPLQSTLDAAGVSLRETIAVNLSLLDREVETLGKIAAAAAHSAKVTRARELLAEAESMAIDADWQLSVFVESDLATVLESVFRALDKARAARILLDATVPMMLE